jgi:hypothetical protein
MRAACWLMTRFGVHDSLIGDLAGHRRGRSAVWLWRQALVAIASAVVAVVGRHYWLAVRAVAIGWASYALVARGHRPAMWAMSDWAWKVDLWLSRTLLVFIPTSFMMVEAAGAVAIGWVVARLHRPYSLPMASMFIVSLLLFDAAGFVNSWRGFDTAVAVNAIFPFGIVPLLVLFGASLGAGSSSVEAT